MKPFWNNIDLHSHTHVGITRDGKSDCVNFSYSLFVDVILNHQLKLMACTNHNQFFFAQFIALKYLAKKCGCNYLLGVELDTVSPKTSTPIHVALIAQTSSLVSNFTVVNRVNKLAGVKRDGISQGLFKELVFSSNEIIELLQLERMVLIPHGDKDRGMLNRPSSEQAAEALQLIKENFVHVFDSKMSKWKLEKVREALDEMEESASKQYGGVLFSDCHDWTKYDESYMNFAMDAEPTFNGFMHAITNPTKRFALQKDATNPTNYIAYALIDYKDGSAPTKLDFSPRYNCIIGKSGSGKSLLLHLIDTVLGEGDKKDTYKSYPYEIKLYGPNGMEISSGNLKQIIGLPIYKEIIESISSKESNQMDQLIEKLASPDSTYSKLAAYKEEIFRFKNEVSQFVDLSNSIAETKKTGSSRFGDFSSSVSFLAASNGCDVISLKDLTKEAAKEPDKIEWDAIDSSVKSFEEKFNHYTGKYSAELNKSLQELRRVLMLVRLEYNVGLYSKHLEEYKLLIIRNALEVVNGSIGSLAKQITTNKNNLLIQRKDVVDSVKKAYLLQKQRASLDISLRADLFKKVQTKIAEGVFVLEEVSNFESVGAYQQRQKDGLFKTRGYLSNLDEAYVDLRKKVDVLQMLQNYINAGVFSQKGVILNEDYFSFRTAILFDGADVSQLNPGDIAKKYITLYFTNKVIGQENSIVVFDQIENDVDKRFLVDEIIPHIEECYSQSQLFIVTHDPIVAVNADPRKYVLAAKDQFLKIRYRSFFPESEIQDELETIAECVDGSKEAIKHRFEIYQKEKGI